MKMKKLKAHDLITCSRCGKTEFLGNAENWNAVYQSGVVTAFICHECQTDEEDLEAQINEATTNYSEWVTISSPQELVDLFRPLLKRAMDTIEAGETKRGESILREEVEKFRKGFNAMHRGCPNMQLRDFEETRNFLAEMGAL